MKFKFSPIYIYLGVIIIAAVLIIVFTETEETKAPQLPQTGQAAMPDDDIHKGMKPSDGGAGAANVQKEVLQKMDSLKNKVAKNSSDTLAMRQYADMLFAAHKPDEAVKYYETILKKDPKRIDMMFALSNVYYFSQEFDKTEEMTNRILKLEPQNVEALYNLGAIAATKGNDARAKEIWQSLIQKFPNHPMAENTRQSLSRLK